MRRRYQSFKVETGEAHKEYDVSTFSISNQLLTRGMERFSTLGSLYPKKGQLSESCLSLNGFRLARSVQVGSVVGQTQCRCCLLRPSDLDLITAALPVFQGALISLAKRCDLPVRKVERWFRCRRNADRPSLS